MAAAWLPVGKLARQLAAAAVIAAAGVLGATSCVAQVPVDVTSNGLPTLAPLLERVTPAVVNIAVVSRSPVADNPLLRDPFFRRFFNIPPDYQPESRTQISAGSGVIVDAGRGFVLTNHHVVANGIEVYVTLKDGRRFQAQLVGSDPATDIALLRIDASDLAEISFGDSTALRVGDYVVAIGNPFGLGQTATLGIVSALGRRDRPIAGQDSLIAEDFIQTDASINPGNSGGALIDLRGGLVGINTAILTPTGVNVGVGFAVPSSIAQAIMDQLVRTGEVRRGRLGVIVQDVTPDVAEALGFAQARGALVTGVERGSSAERAGIRAGDVIIRVNDRDIEGAGDLRSRIGLLPVGERVVVDLIRDGRPLSVRAAVSDQAASGRR
jgi:Do/DeqQ family serine protease